MYIIVTNFLDIKSFPTQHVYRNTYLLGKEKWVGDDDVFNISVRKRFDNYLK